MMSGEHYDDRGKFDKSLVIYEVEDYKSLGIGEYILLDLPRVKYISEYTELTPQNVRRIIKSLKEKRIIKGEYISCPLELLDEMYIEIPKGTGLKGSQLILYGYILHESKKYNGTYDKRAKGIAEKLGITATNVHSILSRLEQKGFAKRLPNGKLLVL